MIWDSADSCTNETANDQLEVENEIIPEISFHAMIGTDHPQTVRVIGQLRNKKVMLLVDGGSTHNFIDEAIVSMFGLPVN